MADNDTTVPEEKSGLTWGDIALVGVSLAAIPLTGGLSAAGLGLLGLRFGATRLAGSMLARSGTNFLARAFTSGATAPAGTAARSVAAEAAKDGAGSILGTAASGLRSLFMKPAIGPTGHGTVGALKHSSNSLFHKAGDTVYEVSKGRALLTGAAALGINGALDGAPGRFGLRAGESVVNGGLRVGDFALSGLGRFGRDADNRYTGGQGQRLVDGAVEGATGAARTAAGAVSDAAAGATGGGEETVEEPDENGVVRRVPRSQSESHKFGQMLGSLFGNNKVAMLFGMGAFWKTKGNFIDKAMGAIATAAFVAIIFAAFPQAKQKLEETFPILGANYNKSSTSAKFNAEAHNTEGRTRDPSATMPAPRDTATADASTRLLEMRDNANAVTAPQTDTPATRFPGYGTVATASLTPTLRPDSIYSLRV